MPNLDPEQLADKERVLMAIAAQTAGTVHDEMRPLRSGWRLRFIFDRPAPQFIPTEMADAIELPLVPGDIVRCKTNPNHQWGISEFVEKTGYSDFVLKEIGSDRLLNMSNEALDVLRFIPQHLLYTGKKQQIYEWASQKAFSEQCNPQADHFKRCGGVSFDGDTLTIWCRAHIFCMEKKSEDGRTLYAQPKKFTLRWSGKTKLKDIIEAMNEQGFGNEFEYLETQPTEGQQGYAKFTRGDIERVLGVFAHAE